MSASELLKKVRKIEIKTKGLSNHIFAGEYHTAFKGRGMAFSEVREYQPGDDIRSIDWNVTARFNNPYIKVFEEEREMTVMLLVDVSASKDFGTQEQMKQELVTELAAVLAFSAIQNNDKIGLIFFSDKVEKFIPPKKGKSHILRIIRELITFEPDRKGTDIGEALRFFNNVIKKRSVCFLISDFLSQDFEAPLRIANKKHDLVAVRIHDKREEELPNVGMVQMKAVETEETYWIDTGKKAIRSQFKSNYLKHQAQLMQLFRNCGVDTIDLRTDQDYVKPLIRFFKRREQ
jgi:uncharacterized protein (DUF58 family)